VRKECANAQMAVRIDRVTMSGERCEGGLESRFQWSGLCNDSRRNNTTMEYEEDSVGDLGRAIGLR
jgi:hypothetical protein